MRKVHLSSQFKKDFKKYRRYPQKVVAFEKVLEYLINERPLPASYLPHALKGRYKGCLECHIEDDYLLIWIEDEVVDLVRIGSHSELFS